MGRWVRFLFGAAGAAERVDSTGSDGASPAARRLACLAVVVIGCAFSYSIGWQRGWMDADRTSDQRFDQLNATLLNAQHSAAAASAAAEAEDSEASDDPLENGWAAGV